MPASSLILFLVTYLLVPFSLHATAVNALPPSPTTAHLPHIQTFASVGDSYAAGLGAGARTDWLCSRYSSAYPSLLYDRYINPLSSPLNQDHDIQPIHDALSCSGASAEDVLYQVEGLEDGSVDVLTISAGGNDIGLSPILNACVFQWAGGGDNECENAVLEATKRINGAAELGAKIATLLGTAKGKMRTWRSDESGDSGTWRSHLPFLRKSGETGHWNGTIYLTGYASFFGTTDHICDNITWSVWRDFPFPYSRQFLHLSLRHRLNQLVRSVNNVLRAEAEKAGPDVVFVDYDGYVAKRRGRYCEAGVREPEPNREDLMFYEWGTVDADRGDENENGDLEDGNLEDRSARVPRKSFEGEIAQLILKTLEQHPSSELAPQMGDLDKKKLAKYLDLKKNRKTGGGDIGDEGSIDDAIWWLLPDNWKRVFHPRPQAHALIARLIYEDLVIRQSQIEKEQAARLLLFIAGVGLFLMFLGFVLWVVSSQCRQKQVRGKRRTNAWGSPRGLCVEDVIEREPFLGPWGKKWAEREAEERDFVGEHVRDGGADVGAVA